MGDHQTDKRHTTRANPWGASGSRGPMQHLDGKQLHNQNNNKLVICQSRHVEPEEGPKSVFLSLTEPFM